MPRIPKRLIAVAGVTAAGGAVLLRRRRAARPTAPSPSASAPPAPPTPVPEPAPVAPPPPEAPRPSVSQAAATVPTPSAADDELVAREEAAAAAEAAGIGGPRLDDAHGDPAMEAVIEAGGGEAEGFELAEEQLIDNATHGGGRGDPSQDAFTPEREADRSTAVDGEADDELVDPDR